MDKRKIILLIVTAIILVTVVVFLAVGASKIFRHIKNANQSKPPGETQLQQAINQALPQVKCELASDWDYQSKASVEGLPELCSCINNNTQKTTCAIVATDTVFFNQARQQYNPDSCERILMTESKDACIAMVKAGMEELKKNNPELLAYLDSQNGNYADAQATLSNYLAANQNDTDVMLNLALLYAQRGLAEHKEDEYVPKAMELVDKVIAAEPQKAEAYQVKGYVNEVKKEYLSALENYNKALELDPNFIMAYVGRGHTYNLMMQLDKALDDFNKAKDIDQKRQYPEIYSNLCRLQSNSPEIEAAIANCQIAISLPSSNFEVKSTAYGILADMYIKTGRYDEAKIQVDFSIASSPKDPNGYVLKAKLDNLTGDFVSGQENAQKAIELDPVKSSAYTYLAQSLAGQAKYNEAVSQSEKGLSLIDQDVTLLKPNKEAMRKESYGILSDIYSKKGDETNAEKYQALADAIK